MKITDAFLGEHAVFYAQFEECERMLDHSSLDSLKHAAAVIAAALETHAQLEDRLLFRPLARVADGDQGIFQLMEDEHAAIAEFLIALSMARDATRASELFGELMAAARAHFQKEEEVAFPRAEQLLSVDELSQLARAWADARGVAIEVTV